MMGIIDDQLQSIDCGPTDGTLQPGPIGSDDYNTGAEKGKILMIPLFQQMLHTTTECNTQVHPKILDLLIP